MENKWKRSKKTDSEENWTLFVTARNQYNALVERTKKTYYNNLFSEEKIPKRIHDNLSELLGKKKEKVLPESYSDNKKMANDFAYYFDEKIERIILGLNSEDPEDSVAFQIEKMDEQSKFSKFEDLTMDKFAKMMSKVKNTYCENDLFPISDVREANRQTT